MLQILPVIVGQIVIQVEALIIMVLLHSKMVLGVTITVLELLVWEELNGQHLLILAKLTLLL